MVTWLVIYFKVKLTFYTPCRRMEEWRCNSISHNKYETCLYASQCCKIRGPTFILSDTQTDALFCLRVPLIDFVKKALCVLLTYRRDLISVWQVLERLYEEEVTPELKFASADWTSPKGPQFDEQPWLAADAACCSGAAIPTHHSAAFCILHTNCSLLWSSWKEVNYLVSWRLAVREIT